MRATHPFPHVPKGVFKVKIQAENIEAIVTPIIVTMNEGSGSFDLISGFEIKSKSMTGAVHWYELDWLIESGQYAVMI